MTTRSWRAAAVAAAAAVFAVLGAVMPAVGAGAVPIADVSNVSPAITSLGSCIASGRRTDLLLLVDESGSLKTTDPDNDRVRSAQYLLTQLASFSKRTDAHIAAKVTAFGDRYRSVSGWQAVGSSRGDAGLTASLDSLKGHAPGVDTDYWTALNGAQKDLATRAEAGTATRCQAIVWFTDGGLAYKARTTAAERSEFGTKKLFAPNIDLTSASAAKAVTAAAQQDLCRTGGVADQIRASGVTMIAIGLGSDSSRFGLMKGIADGSGSCGAAATPSTGVFYPASDIEALLRAFDEVSDPDATPITEEAGICQATDSVCRKGTHSFVLDATTPSVRILATASVPSLTAALVAPDGAVARIPSSGGASADLHGATVRTTWVTTKALSIDLDSAAVDKSAASWTGQWRFAFIDPASSSSGKRSATNIHIRSSIRPTVRTSDLAALHQGATAQLHVGLVDDVGAPFDAAKLLGSVRYTVSLRDSEGADHPLLTTTSKSRIGEPVALPLDGLPVGAATLTLTDTITTASTTSAAGAPVDGTELSPSSVVLPVSVLAPADYPQVDSAVQFGTVAGSGSAKARLEVKGSGCVWIAQQQPVLRSSPQGVSRPEIESDAQSRSSCRHVTSNGAVDLTLQSQGSGNGVLNGTITVWNLPKDGSGSPIKSTVAVSAVYERPLNDVDFVAALVAALVLGVGVPLLLLYLLKWIVSVIPGRRPLAVSVASVEIGSGGVRRDGVPFAIEPRDFKVPARMGSAGTRRIDEAGVLLRVRRGWSPVGAGHVEVTAPGRLVVSDFDSARIGDVALLPLAVHGHFVVMRAPGESPTRGEVLLLVPGDAGEQESARIAAEVTRRVPELLEALVRIDGSPTASAAADPFASASAPSGGSGETASQNPWDF